VNGAMIEVENLSKNYGAIAAIEEIGFSIEAGQILGFLGPNGAGKTTTMRILSGYLPPSSGTARINGYDISEELMAVRKCIGYLPETPPLYPEMTVEQYLYFVARIKGVAAGDRPVAVSSAIARTQLTEKTKTIIRKLSKGYRQRIGIAQAIVNDPPVIILDEPTVGLDPGQIIEVRNLIKSLAGKHTVILSTHILPEVSMACDRVTIINRGKVVATDTPANLMTELSGNQGYQIEVAGDISEIESLLSPIPGVSRVEVLNSSENSSLIKIISRSDADPGREIAAEIVKFGLGLYEMRRIRPSLEDVFLELTTKEAGIDSPQTELTETT